MGRMKVFAISIVLTMASSASLAGGGGCLAGHYQYFDATGQQVGAESVGCQSNWSWGIRTDDAVFVASCGEAS